MTTLERAQQAMEDSGDPALLIALAQAEGIHRIADAIESCCEATARAEQLRETLDTVIEVFVRYVGTNK
jgi:hypothetical protein